MLTWLTTVALAQPIAFVGARVMPVASEPIEFGIILVEDGTITGFGTPNDVEVPENATTIECRGKVIIPGLVDTHSHIASTGDLHEGGITPQVSAIDAIDATHHSLQRAQAGGITVANIMPGSGSLIGGQTAVVKLRDATTVDELLLCDDRRSGLCGGMKMANGTNPQRGDGPDGRMGAAAQFRAAFLEAGGRWPEKNGDRKKREKAGPSDSGPGAQAMFDVLKGDRVVHFHTHRADDIVGALHLAEEFGFDLVLHHVSEAWKVVDVLREADAAVSLILIDSPGGKEEAVEIGLQNAALLEAAGVRTALHTDDPITDSRLFLRMGGLAVRAGMSEAGALKALTLAGAEFLHLDDRVGSIEVGKDEDLVILSGEPFSTWTRVEQTWVDGVKVFDRLRPADKRSAVGGDDPGGRR
jgi:imidazolonepropionase-like amidohydrolase